MFFQLVDIRSRAKALFPQISEHWIASVEKDALKASKSIEKYFKRSNLRREDVESAILKGRARVDGKVDDAADSVNHWLAEIEAREEKAVQEAADQVDMVASEAVNVLGLACESPPTSVCHSEHSFDLFTHSRRLVGRRHSTRLDSLPRHHQGYVLPVLQARYKLEITR